MKIGANYLGQGRCEFVVWAPLSKSVSLKLIGPRKRIIPMQKDKRGYWSAVLDNISAHTRYKYVINNSSERPDPASFYQPKGIHEHSQVIDHNDFRWTDAEWKGIPLEKMIVYELHVGTFTSEATFEAIIPFLDRLVKLGINVIEIMPVAQFPGERNWGYDGAYPFAVQNSYGGPFGFKKLVNACHSKGIAVILDVVYNHLGPEGNYLENFAPYFTDKYKTPWGKTINFDDFYSYGVREFFIQNALYWFKQYHIDALRLDAIHGIFDISGKHILNELSEKVDELSKLKKRKFYLIAESDLNDARIVQARNKGGYGVDAQWCDDFHHALHTLLTNENIGYYEDFGKIEHLVKAIKEGFVYSWQYSEFRKRYYGSSSKDVPAHQFVVFSQNHDQVGNRIFGERLASLVDFEGLKLAAGMVILSPYIPLLFMGEEYAEDAPFLYFVSHSDPQLIEAVREGRKREFKSFKWHKEPPDPQNVDTFLASKLKWEKLREPKRRTIFNFYQLLIKLRKGIPALSNLDKNNFEISTVKKKKVIIFYRWYAKSKVFMFANFNKDNTTFSVSIPDGSWDKIIDSSEKKWLGPGSLLPDIIKGRIQVTLGPLSLALYKKVTR